MVIFSENETNNANIKNGDFWLETLLKDEEVLHIYYNGLWLQMGAVLGALTSDLQANGHKIINVATATDLGDAVTLKQLEEVKRKRRR